MFGVQDLAVVLLLTASTVSGQDWHPTQMLSMRYPCLALAVAMQGRAELHFTIDNHGKPRDITPVRGQPLLLQSAMAHLKSLTLRLDGITPGSVPRTAIY